MHILGLQGMIRREYTYPASLGLTFWNQVSTVGRVHHRARRSWCSSSTSVRTTSAHRPLETNDPWDARTLEWMTASPPPVLQLRRDPDGPLARRVLAPQVRRGQEPAGSFPCRRARADHDEPDTSHGTAHAIHLPEPVVLAARGGARAPDHGLRRHLLLVAGGPRRGRSRWSGSTDGPSSPRWRSSHGRRRDRQKATRRARDHDRSAAHQARDVAVPRPPSACCSAR